MELNVEKLKANVSILEEKLKKINHRLYIVSSSVRFRNIDDTDFWDSVGGIYSTDVHIKHQGKTLDKEWQAIPHEIVLETVKEWQEEFGKFEGIPNDEMNVEDIPNLKINQLRSNVNGELCLLVKYSRYDDDIRAWNFEKETFEKLSNYCYTDKNGKDEDWKRHLPKVVMDDVSQLTGFIKEFIK